MRMEGEANETGKIVEKDKEIEGDLLDLYVCCQCSVYCLVSREVIPGVVPLRRVEEFVKDKSENPPVGKTGPIAVVSGWETIITYVPYSFFILVFLIPHCRNILSYIDINLPCIQYHRESAVARREPGVACW